MLRSTCVLLPLLLSLACDRSPPGRLVPKGAKLVRESSGKSEECYVHRVWVLSTSLPEVEHWARANDLPCADAATPCRRWSTERRASPFWRPGSGEPNGLDSVEATISGNELTVDWGDYTCSGPN